MSVNTAAISGHLVENATLRSTKGGTMVLNFTVAVSEHYAGSILPARPSEQRIEVAVPAVASQFSRHPSNTPFSSAEKGEILKSRDNVATEKRHCRIRSQT